MGSKNECPGMNNNVAMVEFMKYLLTRMKLSSFRNKNPLGIWQLDVKNSTNIDYWSMIRHLDPKRPSNQWLTHKHRINHQIQWIINCKMCHHLLIHPLRAQWEIHLNQFRYTENFVLASHFVTKFLFWFFFFSFLIIKQTQQTNSFILCSHSFI